MSVASTVRLECPSCGLRHEAAGDRTLAHHCPRCGTDLVADGLLVEAEPGAGEPSPTFAAGPTAEPFFPAPLGAEAIGVALLAAFLAWSSLTRGFAAAALAGADLVFHEAGHVIFAILGWRFLTILGGTLGQLAFPVAAALGFARVRRAAPLAVAVVWIGVNLVDIGTYAADASARVLPLLAPDPDSHDWWNMLGTLGVRDHCRGIGGTIQVIGWVLWGAAPAWLGWRWGRERLPGRVGT